MLYRISFLTEMLVDADNAFEAERIGYNNLSEEVKRSISEVCEVSQVKAIKDLKKSEYDALPWGIENCLGQTPVSRILAEAETPRPKKLVHAKKI